LAPSRWLPERAYLSGKPTTLTAVPMVSTEPLGWPLGGPDLEFI